MEFKKLKLATGILGLVGVVLAVVCYIVSFVIASQYEGEELLVVAVGFIVLAFPLGFVCLIEIVFTIFYMLGKFNTRVFFVVGAVSSLLNLIICFVSISFAIVITLEIGGIAIPIITALCVLLVITVIVFKIMCAVKFKMNEEEISNNKE